MALLPRDERGPYRGALCPFDSSGQAWGRTSSSTMTWSSATTSRSNNVSVYTGVELEDDVFCGPSCVFTNVSNPRSQIVRHHLYERTLVRRGATIGANATIVCPVTIGRYAFIRAGAVVVSDVADYALMLGVPARQRGWMSRHGHRLQNPSDDGIMVCPESGWHYKKRGGARGFALSGLSGG